MRRMPRALIGLAGLMGLGLSGCALLPQEQLYQLQAPVTSLPPAGEGAAILLGPVEVADYLQRDYLVQRQPDGALVVDSKARWAGNPAWEIRQLLLRQLSQNLQSSRLVLAPDDTGFKADFQVLLAISRLDSGTGQPARLEAQWRLLDSSGKLLNSRLVELQENHDDSLASQVQAQGRLLVALAGQLGQALRPEIIRQADAREKAARQAREQEAQAARRRRERPAASSKSVPIRTEMGVFRF